MTPTDEQQAAIAATKHSSDSIFLEAFAGCGKTTTLTLMAKEVKVPGLALAFNVAIKEELSKRFPKNFVVQTMNGLGHSSLMRAFPSTQFTLDKKGKLGRLVSEVAKDFKTELDSEQWSSVRELTSKVMQAGLVPQDQGDSPLIADNKENWRFLADDLFIPEDEQEFMIELAREVLLRNNAETLRGRISYDDQVYASTCIKGKFPQFPLLMVDEAQDLSPLNHAMLTRAARPDGRLIVCGDARQSIYAFRGADSDSIGKIKALRRHWIELPLTMTFRCPKVIVARQQGHAPGFRAFDGNGEGAFARLPPEVASLFDRDNELRWEWEQVEMLKPEEHSTVAVLCRNNAPLLALAFKLIRQRISVVMLGRDIGQGLVALSKRLFPSDEALPETMASLVTQWLEHERSLAIANHQEEKVDGLEDRAECLRAVLSYPEVTNARDLRRELKDLFARESGSVTLASIHKAKGMEWDLVVLLDPWRLPSKWAREAAKQGDDRQLRQENNLKYVAETRTKHTLIHASLDSFE